MDDITYELFQLAKKGYNCSQIVLALGLKQQEKENEALIQAAGALGGGIGFAGKTCGALTGGACVLGLFFGQEDPRLKITVNQLIDWFEEQYDSIECEEILGTVPIDKNNIDAMKCGSIVANTYSKIRQLLAEQQINLDGEEK